MGTRAEFIQRQHDEVKTTLGKLRDHLALCEEKLQEDAENEEMAAMAAQAREGIAALEPILADFDDAGVDPEELIKYARDIEEWQAKEAELAKKLA